MLSSMMPCSQKKIRPCYLPAVLMLLLFMCFSFLVQAQVHRRSAEETKTHGKTSGKKKKKSLMKHITLDVGGAYYSLSTQTRTVLVSTGGANVMEPFKITGSIIAVYVYPKYHLWSSDKISVSLGIPLGVGGSDKVEPINPNPTGPDNSTYGIGLSLPIMADINFGACALNASRDEDAKLGGYLGVGLALVSAGANVSGDNDRYYSQVEDNNLAQRIWTTGLIVHAGVRAKFGKLPLGLGVSYMPSTSKGYSVFGGSLYVPL